MPIVASCLALRSTNPSCTTLVRTTYFTCGVMFTEAIRAGRWNVR